MDYSPGSNIGWNNFDANEKGYWFKPKKWQGLYVYLYFVSDDKIENGELCYYDNRKIIKYSNEPKCKKIIATTDISLTNVFKIPEAFESFFVKSQGSADKVEVDENFNILRIKKWSSGKETDWLPYKHG